MHLRTKLWFKVDIQQEEVLYIHPPAMSSTQCFQVSGSEDKGADSAAPASRRHRGGGSSQVRGQVPGQAQHGRRAPA